jgi:hypothetical protein
MYERPFLIATVTQRSAGLQPVLARYLPREDEDIKKARNTADSQMCSSAAFASRRYVLNEALVLI